jgi:murein peptide amidase A
VIRRCAATLVAALAVVGCAESSSAADIPAGASAATTVNASSSTVADTVCPTTTVAPTTAPTTAPVTSLEETTTTTSTTLSTSTTVAAPASTAAPPPAFTDPGSDFLGEEQIGTSAGGLPITAEHRGTPGGAVVLVVGVIHGNENDGLAVLDNLRRMPLPVGIDLWLLDAMNPDGLAADVRGNANGVDLNRNFPHDWTPIAEPGNWQYSGSGPASEPETQAFTAFADRIRPRLTLWYHQDLYRISPSDGPDGPLRRRYAELTGLPYVSVTGGIYTGVAATWVRKSVPDALSFIVELGDTLPADDAVVHANAVLDVASMIRS